MRFTSVALALTAILLLAACGDSDEDVPTNAPTATTTPSPGGDIVICPRIGNGSTPTTPTPVPSCSPGPAIGDLSNASLQETDPPPLPSGFTAHSIYYTVEGGASGLPAQLSVEITDDDVPIERLFWYTYIDGEWQRLEPAVEPVGSTGYPDAYGAFDTLPSNIILLAEPQ